MRTLSGGCPMRRLSIAAIAATSMVAVAQIAAAADLGLPVHKAPPPPLAPVYNWTGFYAGLNAGVGWSGNDVNTTGWPLYANPTHADSSAQVAASAASATASIPTSSTSFIGGGQVGYNFQMNTWVVGLEADIDGLSPSSQTNTALVGAPIATGGFNFSDDSATKTLNYLGTVRGRVGFLVTPALLLYGTGGLAYGDPGLTTSVFQARAPKRFDDPPSGGASFSETRFGWTLGAGAEWMFLPNWSVRAEYLHYDLGNVGNDFSISTVSKRRGVSFTTGISSGAQISGDIVRVGVSYHLN